MRGTRREVRLVESEFRHRPVCQGRDMSMHLRVYEHECAKEV